MMRLTSLALLGLALGLSFGLLDAWVISPRPSAVTPASLRADYQADYIQLVARSFAVEGHLERARARLAQLGVADPAQAVTALAQRTAASGGDPESVRALAALASALGARPAAPSPGPLPSPSPMTVEPTTTVESAITPGPAQVLTATPIPDQPPTPTLPGAFALVGKQAVCDPRLAPPLIQVLTLNPQAQPVPGMEVLVEWAGGFDHFFTGLKPERGDGYGDFAMTEGVEYTVRLALDPALAVGGLTVEPCADAAGNPALGSWLLVFRQP